MNFESAKKLFTQRAPTKKKLGYETWAYWYNKAGGIEGNERIAIQYFKTEIVAYFPDGHFILNNGGYFSSGCTQNKYRNGYLPDGCSLHPTWIYRSKMTWKKTWLLGVPTEQHFRPWNNLRSYSPSPDFTTRELPMCMWRRNAKEVLTRIVEYSNEYVKRGISRRLDPNTCDGCGRHRGEQELGHHLMEHLDKDEYPASLIYEISCKDKRDLFTKSLAINMHPNNWWKWHKPKTKKELIEQVEGYLETDTVNTTNPMFSRARLRDLLAGFFFERFGYEIY